MTQEHKGLDAGLLKKEDLSNPVVPWPLTICANLAAT